MLRRFTHHLRRCTITHTTHRFAAGTRCTPIPARILLPRTRRMAEPAAAATAVAEPLHIRESKPIWKQHGRRSEFLPAPDAAASSAAAASSSSAAAAAAPASVSSGAFVAPSVDASDVGFVPLVPIDEAQFNEDVTVVALRVPAKLCGMLIQHFKSLTPDTTGPSDAVPPTDSTPSSWLLLRSRISPVADGPTRDVKLILMNEWLRTLDDLRKLPAATQELLATHAAAITPCLYTFTLTYDYFPQDVALQRLLPASVQVPAGFETIGHIAHLNLSEAQLPYGGVIARVLLDKNPHLRTVVSKVGTIQSEFRVFDMAVLGGDRSCRTEVREHGCTFSFDFSRVYWNSRLSTEHTRMMSCFHRGQLIVDLMCGIGPFVVPAARALGPQPKFLGGAPAIYGNDLNPSSFESLRENLTRNKVASLVSAHNMDGRAFLWDVVRREQLSASGRAKGTRMAHVLMNLPAIAIEFLDAFVGLYSNEDGQADPAALASVLAADPPLVHVYCFSKFVEAPLTDLVPRIEAALGASMPPPVWVKDIGEQSDRKHKRHKDVEAASAAGAGASSSSGAAVAAPAPLLLPSTSLPSLHESHVRFVRNVAPNKDMYCVSFHVPRGVLTATPSYRSKQQQQQQAAAAQPQAAQQQPQQMEEDVAPSAKRKLPASEEQPFKKSREKADEDQKPAAV